MHAMRCFVVQGGIWMSEQLNELELQKRKLYMLREEIGLNRKDFALKYGIPLRTIEDWEHGKRKMPSYLLRLLAYKVKYDKLIIGEQDSSNNINIICDAEGKKVVLINDIIFKSRRAIDWVEIEEYLKEYIGRCFVIADTSEKIYIGPDFPDEYVGSNDRIGLKGANEKAKANMITSIGEVIQIATNKMEYPDFGKKHKSKAQYGWYRYDTRFGIPVYDESGELIRYNIFATRMLVRCDADGKLYLYDFVRTKKETRSPHEQ